MSCLNLFKRALALALLTLLVTACGGGGGGGGAPAPSVITASGVNVLGITVDSGPAGTGYNVNRLYASLTLCLPGTTQCQTLDHVLVDTGSTGLRVLSSALLPGLALSRQAAASGFPLLNCSQFVDNSYAWGPVALADVVLAGKTAANVPIQVIADPAFTSLSSACMPGGTSLSTAVDLGANGILGMDLFKMDCGSTCTTVANNDFYYTCTTAACSAVTFTTASLAQQVKNPVPLFATDNNGLLIDLPAASLAGVPSLNGVLIFGIGTQANNQLGASTVLTTSAGGDITTQIGSQNMASSFLDTGSNGLFFVSSITACTPGTPAFYCPVSRVNLTASVLGANAVSSSVNFAVDNALTLFGTGVNHVLPTLAGTLGDATAFDWGLPFFYGRRVFIGIEGLTPAVAPGSFYAF